ncbi:unnamed protein product [Cuscuta europaea]|uniref:Aluminum-activated malate transporter n=1 Tax=Cuscuta europaea TaxID=41803 RepID=A0A9P1EHZ3_CUSEU|nr:unnamed protein product [Cuscuta europaea]
MSEKKGSIVEINIQVAAPSIAEDEKKISQISLPCKGWIFRVADFYKEDIKRVFFPLKVGLAVLLVSLITLFQAPYQLFGDSSIWSIVTVVMIFEYNVGATLNRGLNRALGSMIAVGLAIAVSEIAVRSGHIAEPMVIGTAIFLVAMITALMKLWPPLVPYEYGFRVTLFTFCLIIVSGYRTESAIKFSVDRIYSIVIGTIIAVLVNVLVCPVWAGELLHKELVSSFNVVADSLEDCVRKYLEEDDGRPSYLKFRDEPAAYLKSRAALSSPEKIESLAISAKWEPPHGRFSHVIYPWSEYVKVGEVLRCCACEVIALHGVLHAEIQAPYSVRTTFHKEIQEAAAYAIEVVRVLGKDISDMQQSLKGCHLAKVHTSTRRLQKAIENHMHLLIISSKQDQQISQTSLSDLDELSEQPCNRIYSWLSTRDNLDPQMETLESNATLSVTTFACLLIQLIARLDHLVDAVDKLSEMAKFKLEALKEEKNP